MSSIGRMDSGNMFRIHLAHVIVLVVSHLLVLAVGGQQCSRTVKSNEVLKSEFFPSAFPIKVCHYDVIIQPRDTDSEYIVAIFDVFNINDGETAKKPLKEINKIEVHDGEDRNLGTYTDTAPYGTVAKISKDRTNKASLKITFSAVHNAVKLSGFKMHFKLLKYRDLVPSTTFQGIRGFLTSPGYPYNYPNDHVEIYRITTNNTNGVIRFRFADIALGDDTKITVYDGNKVASQNVVYQFPDEREARTEWNYFVSTNTMTVLFQSPPEETARGFNMTYVENCQYNDIDTPCDEVPQLNFMRNLIIIGAGTAGLLFVVLVISLICYCSRKMSERRRGNMGMQRFD